MSDKFFELSAFTKSSGPWREWAEDFVEIIAMRNDKRSNIIDPQSREISIHPKPCA